MTSLLFSLSDVRVPLNSSTNVKSTASPCFGAAHGPPRSGDRSEFEMPLPFLPLPPPRPPLPPSSPPSTSPWLLPTRLDPKTCTRQHDILIQRRAKDVYSRRFARLYYAFSPLLFRAVRTPACICLPSLSSPTHGARLPKASHICHEILCVHATAWNLGRRGQGGVVSRWGRAKAGRRRQHVDSLLSI
ncbi:hypothetical protein DFH07DRAFT_472196 [Mycena maculata]|uniref:Uncharacterized protein n=1 Tax=Mycena maculata TaxID=230809 RepID=A0AAD7NES8_9AGAR|nr:hypothetical protein DFH07DRAFT_472196 [Mycena maculata]